MTMTNRTLTDIRENIDYVGCDNATALDLCAQIDRLTRDLDLARAEADRLRSYQDTWERTRTSWEKENGRMRDALEIIAGIRPCSDNLLGNADIARLALEQELNETETKR